MDWGIYLITAQPPSMTQAEVIGNSTAYAMAAEELGFSHAWVLEHHFTRYGLVGSALTQAAYLLGKTRKLQIGTAINVIPLEHPLRIAEEVALLDHLSGGRIKLGIGRGIFKKDYAVFGVDMSRNREILELWYDTMIDAWTKPTVSASSELLTFPEVKIYPSPLTTPHPPMYAVAISPTTIEWAASKGLPMILNYTSSDEVKRGQLDLYNEVAESHGFNPADIPHALSFLAGASRDGTSIRNASRQHLAWWLDEGHRASSLFDPGAEEVKGYEWYYRQWEEVVMRGEGEVDGRVERYFEINPIGSPQQCVDILGKSLEVTGLKHVILGFESAGDRTAVMDSIELFSSEVMSHFNGVSAPQSSATPVARLRTA